MPSIWPVQGWVDVRLRIPARPVHRRRKSLHPGLDIVAPVRRRRSSPRPRAASPTRAGRAAGDGAWKSTTAAASGRSTPTAVRSRSARETRAARRRDCHGRQFRSLDRYAPALRRDARAAAGLTRTTTSSPRSAPTRRYFRTNTTGSFSVRVDPPSRYCDADEVDAHRTGRRPNCTAVPPRDAGRVRRLPGEQPAHLSAAQVEDRHLQRDRPVRAGGRGQRRSLRTRRRPG